MRPPALMMALYIWAMSHGIASLFLRAAMPAGACVPMSPEELLEAGTLVYCRAWGFPRCPQIIF